MSYFKLLTTITLLLICSLAESRLSATDGSDAHDAATPSPTGACAAGGSSSSHSPETGGDAAASDTETDLPELPKVPKVPKVAIDNSDPNDLPRALSGTPGPTPPWPLKQRPPTDAILTQQQNTVRQALFYAAQAEKIFFCQLFNLRTSLTSDPKNATNVAYQAAYNNWNQSFIHLSKTVELFCDAFPVIIKPNAVTKINVNDLVKKYFKQKLDNYRCRVFKFVSDDNGDFWMWMPVDYSGRTDWRVHDEKIDSDNNRKVFYFLTNAYHLAKTLNNLQTENPKNLQKIRAFETKLKAILESFEPFQQALENLKRPLPPPSQQQAPSATTTLPHKPSAAPHSDTAKPSANQITPPQPDKPTKNQNPVLIGATAAVAAISIISAAGIGLFVWWKKKAARQKHLKRLLTRQNRKPTKISRQSKRPKVESSTNLQIH